MLIRGAYFRQLAEGNRIKRVRIPAPRGRISDKNHKELVRNSIRYFDSQGEVVERGEALRLEAKGEELEKVWLREYPEGKITAHLSGYLGEATKEEVSANEGIQSGDLVGRGGVEQFYDELLRGKPGEKLVEVTAIGETVRELGRRESQSGGDLLTTLDLRWQKAAWQAFENKKGAIVVLNSQNGEVLALVSSPSFDPNIFTKGRDEGKIGQLLNDGDLPLLNRAIGGAYHPGSVFKMITAAAGLEEGKIDADKEVEDVGEIRIGEWRFGNWYWLQYGQTEGMVSLIRAIKRSNDIYFYKVGEWLGAQGLLDWAGRFGLGEPTGIDLPGEINGFLPSPEWKEEVKGERWFLGNTYHLAIGQGDLTTTPLQIAAVTAVIANGGKLCQPHLTVVDNCRDLNIQQKHLELIKQGMIEACSSGGTGFPFFDFKPRVACKTGTAEVGDGTDDAHAWFTLFYPSDNPEVVITVLVERGGSGSYVAAPIAKEIIERYRGEFKELEMKNKV